MLDKFLFGNKHIPEMYFGNIPVAKIYFGTTLIWEKEGYVPYDSTCTLIIDGDSNTQKFSVQVMKNGVDVTSSLDHYTDFSYIVNDVLPSYRITNQTVTNKNEVSITDLINKYKQTESISDTRYDNTKGEFSYAGCRVYSKAGGSFLDTGSVATQNNIVIPYTLTEDNSTNDVWMVVSQNTSPTPVEIKTLQVATTFVGTGNTEIYVIHESGICVYKKILYSNTPSITTKEIGGITYNYVTIDLTGLDTGTFSLKRFEKYFIKIKHANNNNHYYYRNGGILGIVGYTTANINVPNDPYNVSSLTYDGFKPSETDMLSVNSLNHYAKYTGASNKFETNHIYKCKLAFTYRGEITDKDIWMLAANNGEVGYYSGPASELGITGAFVKSGDAILVSEQSNYTNIISSEPQEGTIFKYTGNTTGSIFVKNRFYSCNTQMTIKAEITSAPNISTVSVDDIYFATDDIWYDAGSEGWQGKGFYKVTSIGETKYFVNKQNSPVTDETDNMKAKLSSFNRSSYFDEMYGTSTDLNGITLSTDHKYEVLMGA